MADYQLNHTGAQIDTNLNVVDGISAVNGIVKCNGSGTPSQAVEGTDFAPPYTYGTSELTPGTSTLATGKLYFCYEA